jgi:tetratricopeptide (TPR) repeat protein
VRIYLIILFGLMAMASGVSAAPIDDLKADGRKAAAAEDWASAARYYEQALKLHPASKSQAIDLALDAVGAQMMAGNLDGAQARLKSVDPKQCSADQALTRHGLSIALQGRRYYLHGARRAAELSKVSDRAVMFSFLEYWTRLQPEQNVRDYAVEQLEYMVTKFSYRIDTAYLANAISVKADLPLGQILTQISRDCPSVSNSRLFQIDYAASVNNTEPLVTLACLGRALKLSKTPREKAATLSLRSAAFVRGGKWDEAMKDASECLKIADENGLDDLKREAGERIDSINKWKATDEHPLNTAKP